MTKPTQCDVVRERELKVYFWISNPNSYEGFEKALKDFLKQFGYELWASGYNLKSQIRDLAFIDNRTSSVGL